MLPISKVQNLISKHAQLEKELSSEEIDKKNFAEKSKEYSNLNEIIIEANAYKDFEKNKKDLEKIILDIKSDQEIKEMAQIELEDLNKNLIIEEKLSHIKTPITLSIIGCVVNGPGEAAQTDIGITGGGKGNNMLYLSGIESEKITNNEIISKIVNLVENKVQEIEKNN